MFGQCPSLFARPWLASGVCLWILQAVGALLKDLIHRKANPRQRWAAKYGFKGEPIVEKLIALYSKQILEAMAYFQVLGLPCSG